ncbi:MAG: arginine--tRNA ligase [Lachnospiraceae bacterium]|nr:arginine--tRNA ligase [Lachnospiraceae bacterium]
MNKLIEIISDEFKKAFVDCGYDEKLGKVTVSNRPDLCEYQCNGAMAGAKMYKKAPIMIANEVLEKIGDNDKFLKVEAVMPGFINITLSPAFVSSYINEMAADDKLGVEDIGKGETVVVDYGGANVAKPLHVGHLRPAVIGESVKRIYKYMGYNTIGDVHLGDWGLQMGLIIMELKERQPDLCYFDESFEGPYPEEAPFTIDDLSEIYPAASAKSKEDADFKEAAQLATVKIQQGYPPYLALWKHIMNVSIPDLEKNYDNLDVHFELWKGESDAKPYIEDMVQNMIDKGIAHESQGALVVDIAEETDKKEYPPCIIKKSDGASLYATTDLATIVQRVQDYNPAKIVYFTDKRQELHFIQVFRVARKAGIVSESTQLSQIGFGTMNGTDGKPFKTRDGGVMRLEMLVQNIEDAVYEKIMANREVSEEEARATSKIVGLAALKYGDLSNQAPKDYIFDIDRFTSFEGNTGPYILYTIVRIKSILEKYKESGKDLEASDVIGNLDDAASKELMLSLSKFNEMVEEACNEIAPHKVCQFIYDLSNSFNHFYHETKILSEEDENKQLSYINLLKVTKRVLETCIDMLGFTAPEKM